MTPRRAGQGARGRFNQVVTVTVILLSGAYLTGMVLALVTRPDRFWLYAITSPFVMAIFLYLFKRGDVKEVVRIAGAWRTGAIGEEQVGALLDSLIPEGFRVLHDVQTGRGNLDHVVIGPTGIFAIETKAVAGRLWLAKGARLMNKGFETEKWIGQARSEALEVKRRIRGAGLNLWVEALVVVTRIELPKGPMKTKSVWVIESKDLLREIKKERGRRLTPEEIAMAAAAI